MQVTRLGADPAFMAAASSFMNTPVAGPTFRPVVFMPQGEGIPILPIALAGGVFLIAAMLLTTTRR